MFHFTVIFFVLLYASVFHLIYVNFLHDFYEYAYYLYFERNFYLYLIAYFLIVLPVSCYRKNNKNLSSFGVVLIYTLCYVPGQLFFTFMFDGSSERLILIQTILLVSMCLFFISTKVIKDNNLHQSTNKILSSNMQIIIHIFSLIMTIWILYEYSHRLQFVNFSEIYELRANFTKIKKSKLFDYLFLFFAKISIPFYITLGLLRKQYSYTIIGIFLAVMCYMLVGAKGILLTPILIASIYYIYNGKRDWLLLTTIWCVLLLLFLLILPNQGIFFSIKAILGVRVFGTPGWTLVVYDQLANAFDYTYYTHIGLINLITNAYPYGDFSLGQMIAVHIVGTSSAANFNANFWASDGFISWGLSGVIFITIIMSLFFIYLDTVTKDYKRIYLLCIFISFFMTLLNAPFSLSLLSGGGLIMLLLHSRLANKYRFRL